MVTRTHHSVTHNVHCPPWSELRWVELHVNQETAVDHDVVCPIAVGSVLCRYHFMHLGQRATLLDRQDVNASLSLKRPSQFLDSVAWTWVWVTMSFPLDGASRLLTVSFPHRCLPPTRSIRPMPVSLCSHGSNPLTHRPGQRWGALHIDRRVPPLKRLGTFLFRLVMHEVNESEVCAWVSTYLFSKIIRFYIYLLLEN